MLKEQWKVSETPTDDPIDGIDVINLDGWTKHDSDRSREKNLRQRLGRDSGDRYTDSWVRFDNG